MGGQSHLGRYRCRCNFSNYNDGFAILKMEIKITIKKEDNETTTDSFTTYQDAINYLNASEDEEMDKSHAHVMSEHK